MWFPLFLTSSGLIFVVESRASNAHTPDTYPDSLVDFGLCRLTEPSLVCDPDHVLNSKNEVDGVLLLHYAVQRVLFHTNCSCTIDDRRLGFCENKSRGYAISVIVLEKIAESADGSDNRTELIDVFSRVLHKRLRRGQCEDDVLIVFSLADNLLHTVLGAVAQRKIHPQLVGQVEQLAENMHLENGDYTSGLVLLVNIYGRVLAGENYFEALPNVYEAGLQKILPKWPQWVVLTLLIGIPVFVTVIVVLCALFFAFRRYCQREGSGYTAGQAA